MHDARRGRAAHSWRACVAALALLATAASAGAEDLDTLEAHAAGRRLALSGDVAGAQRAWDAVLARRGRPAHAVELGSACGASGVAAALEAWRTASPIWIAGDPAGCVSILWGLFDDESEARDVASRLLLDGRGQQARVVRLEPPLAGVTSAAPAAAQARVTTPAPPAAQPRAPEAAPAPPPEVSPPTPAPPAVASVVPPPPAPAPTEGMDSARGARLFAEGNEAYARGDVTASIQAFTASTSADPTNPRSFNNLGTALLIAGRPAEAESAFRRAIVLDPTYARAHLNLSTALYAQDRAEDAALSLERVLELDPQAIDAYHNLGALRVEQRRWRDAEDVLLRGLRANPDEPRLRADLEQVRSHAEVGGQAGAAAGPCREAMSRSARVRMADRFFRDGRDANQRGDHAEAEQAFEQALECDPTSGSVLNHLGAERLLLGEWDQARLALEKAVEIQPDSLEAAVNLSFALFHAGRCDDAVAILTRLAESRSASAEPRFQLGRMLYRCGRSTEAATILEREGADPRATRLLARIRGETVTVP